MKKHLARLIPCALIMAAFSLTPALAANNEAVRDVPQFQQAAPPAPQPQAAPPPAAQQQAQPTQAQKPATPDLRGYWLQRGGLYYQIVAKSGSWPVPHNYQAILVKKISPWLVPWQVGTVSCVFNLKPGATSGPGMVLTVTAGVGMHWAKAKVDVVGPDQLNVSTTVLVLPPVSLKRVQSID